MNLTSLHRLNHLKLIKSNKTSIVSQSRMSSRKTNKIRKDLPSRKFLTRFLTYFELKLDPYTLGHTISLAGISDQ